MSKTATMDTNAIQNLTRHILNLPALPAITTSLLQMVDNPAVSSHRIAGLLASDQSLSARILRLANSPFYGFAHEIKTVQLAVTLLGSDTIANLALSMSVMNRFTQKFEDDTFDHAVFWKHSILTANLSEKLAVKLHCKNPGSGYTAGMLHDIGKLVIHEYLNPAHRNIEALILEHGAAPYQAEREALSVDHAEIGGWLCRNWNLPDEIVAAVNGHHTPITEESDPCGLVSVVFYADRAASRFGQPWPQRTLSDAECDLSGLKQLCASRNVSPLDETMLKDLCAREIENIMDFLSLLQNG
jgi:putative nucleotidyltransferase with HDIG domain